MDKKILGALKKIEFFDRELSSKNLCELDNRTYSVNIEDKSYLIILSEKNSKADPRSIDYGRLDDISMYYEIYNFKNLITLKEYLNKSKSDEIYNIACKFGKKLYEFHQKTPEEDVNWYNIFNTKANYLFYMHGLSDHIGDRDYILIDFISHNRHLAKSVKNSYIYINMSLDNILLNGKDQFIFLNCDYKDIGDPVFDFTKINKIAINYPGFSKGVIDGYFNNKKPPIKFFRLLALYQAYLILKNIVKSREDINYKYSKEEESALLLMYDYFNQEVPSWVQEGL